MRLLPTMISAAALTAVITAASPSFAFDAVAGQAKAAVCAACHGANGISLIPMYPNLAGQKHQYLATEMKEMQSRVRPSPICGQMMMALSEQDIDNLAAYYAGLSH